MTIKFSDAARARVLNHLHLNGINGLDHLNVFAPDGALAQLNAALELMPADHHLVITPLHDELRAQLRSVLVHDDVGGVTSRPPDYAAFVLAIVQMLHEQFDPTYDACEWGAK